MTKERLSPLAFTAKLYVSALASAQDNLARATMQRERMPEWVSGNGEPIDEVVAGYWADVNEIKENAAAMGIAIADNRVTFSKA